VDGVSLRENIVVAIWECYEYFMFSCESRLSCVRRLNFEENAFTQFHHILGKAGSDYRCWPNGGKTSAIDQGAKTGKHNQSALIR